MSTNAQEKYVLALYSSTVTSRYCCRCRRAQQTDPWYHGLPAAVTARRCSTHTAN
jgi:hypothetical protein